MKIFLIDHTAPWVRSLFTAMRPGAEIFALYPHIPYSPVRSKVSKFSWTEISPGFHEKPILLPGFRKFPKISMMLIRRAIRKAVGRWGAPDLIVYTLPFYAPVAAALSGRFMQAYQAHDPFRFYDWDAAQTLRLEKQMTESVNVTFSVARALSEDFRKMTDKPIFECPNAVSADFLEELSKPVPDIPEDLKSLARPIVGCVGQINRSYDWPMIGALADGMSDVTFAFVGPIFEEPPEIRKPMEEVMRKPNVKFLGRRPHDQLPAYLRAFDVCLNPLSVTEHNDRRSPLRLYDYLATDRPIVSTAIREAFTHGSLLRTFKTPQEGIDTLRTIFAGKDPVDMLARSTYIRQNTWEHRARQFLADVQSLK